MQHARWHHHALPGPELVSHAFELEQQRALEHEEQRVFLVVLVPVELAMKHADPRDRVVHDARALVPRLLVRLDQRAGVHHLERAVRQSVSMS